MLSEHLGDVEHAELWLPPIASCRSIEAQDSGCSAPIRIGWAPVLAMRYDGNLDFADESCAALVDAEIVPVGDGRGAYPNDALWGGPRPRGCSYARALPADVVPH